MGDSLPYIVPWLVLGAVFLAINISHRWEVWKMGRPRRELVRRFGRKRAAEIENATRDAWLRAHGPDPSPAPVEWAIDTLAALDRAAVEPSEKHHSIVADLMERDLRASDVANSRKL